MGLFDFWRKQPETKGTDIYDPVTNRTVLDLVDPDGDIFKAYIPNFLYKPPYGMPRKVNVVQLKALAKNPYVFSVIKTMCDEISSLPWEIKLKERYQDDATDYSDKIDEITRFFENPNGNEQSFGFLMRKLITDILEVDAGLLVKVFNKQGEFRQLFARDGGTFLKNPDIYGYIGNRADFVPPMPSSMYGVEVDIGGTPTVTQQQLMKQYGALYKERAAYFQYGWTAGSMPVPFGKREIVYIMQNPRGDSIYGRSPIEVLMNTILNLVYGQDYNLDFYTNNNMPEGVIQLLGAEKDHIRQFRENWQAQFQQKDDLGNTRRKGYQVPLSSSEVKFTQFQLSSKDMEIISQQQWFTKILWMCFGVNADEMGFTEDTNRAEGVVQSRIFKRKAIKPLIDLLAYHFNTQIVPEFFPKGNKDEYGFPEVEDFRDVPVEFEFVEYDPAEEKMTLDILEQEIRIGVKTPEMAAKELGINLQELEESKMARVETALEAQNVFSNDSSDTQEDTAEDSEDIEAEEENPEDDIVQVENKSQSDKINKGELLKELDDYIDSIGSSIEEGIDRSKEQGF